MTTALIVGAFYVAICLTVGYLVGLGLRDRPEREVVRAAERITREAARSE